MEVVDNHFLEMDAILATNNKQTGDPIASLLSTTEKEVICKNRKDKKIMFAIFLSSIMGISTKCTAIYYRECPEPNSVISFTFEPAMTILINNVSNSMIMIMMYDYM